MPIRYDAPSHEIEKLFNSLNGILFTGGETNIRDLNSTYMRTANQLLKATLAAHAKGDHVPLWYNHPLADMNFEFDFFSKCSLSCCVLTFTRVRLSQGNVHGHADTICSCCG